MSIYLSDDKAEITEAITPVFSVLLILYIFIYIDFIKNKLTLGLKKLLFGKDKNTDFYSGQGKVCGSFWV